MELFPVIIILAGIVATDTTAGPQLMISEPIVTCTALGMLFGRPELGIMLGILFQLLWLAYLPLGAVRFTDNNMAAYIATASIMLSARLFEPAGTPIHAAIIPALITGTIVGVIGLHMRNIERRMNDRRTDKLISRFEAGETPSIPASIAAGLFTAFCKGVIMALVFIPVGTVSCGLVYSLPGWIVRSLEYASSIIWGTAAASAIYFFWSKGKRRFLFLGSVGGIAWYLLRVV